MSKLHRLLISVSRGIPPAGYILAILAFAVLLPAKTLAQTPLELDIGFENQRLQLSWNGIPGFGYELLSRDSLSHGAWEPIARTIALQDGAAWVDEEFNGTRFYLVRQLPAGISTPASITHSQSAPPLLVGALTISSYAQARSLIENFAALGPLRLPLPLPDLEPFADIAFANVDIDFDDEHRAITFSGTTSLLGQTVEMLVTANWGTNPTASLTLGLRFSQFDLALLSEGFADSPLAALDFKDTVIIIAQGEETIDPLKLPGRAFAFYEGVRIDVERGVNIFNQLDLSPLPVSEGLKLLGIPETRVALQGIVGVEPNFFFHGVRSFDSALLHFRSDLGAHLLPGLPAWVTTSGRRLDLSMLTLGGMADGHVPMDLEIPPDLGLHDAGPLLIVTVTDELKIKLGDDELMFETVTDLSTLEEGGTTTLVGTSLTAWEQPFGFEWLSLTNLTLEVTLTHGEVEDAILSATFLAGETEGVAMITVPEEEAVPAEIRLSTEQLTATEISGLLALAGLNVSNNDLPEDLVVNEAAVYLTTGVKRSFSVTGKIPVLGTLQAEALITVVDLDGDPDLIFSVQPLELRLSDLIPATAGTLLGDLALPLAGFTSGEREYAVPASEFDPAAQNFFERVFGTRDFTLAVTTGVTFETSLPLSPFSPALLEAAGLNQGDQIRLEGGVDVTMGILTGSGSVTLDALYLEALLPPTPLPGLPAALQPVTVLGRKLVLVYSNRTLDLRIETELSATLDGQQHRFSFTGSLTDPITAGGVELTGTMLGAWENPSGLEWLTVDRVQMRLKHSAAEIQASLEGRMEIAGRYVQTSIDLITEDGQHSARVRAALEQLSLNDFISWIQERLGVSPFGEGAPDGLLELRQLVFEFQTSPRPQFTVTATATLLNSLPSEVLFTLVPQEGRAEPVLSFQFHESPISSVLTRFEGTLAGDLQFPATAYTFSRTPLSVPSSELSSEARSYFQGIHGTPDFTFITTAGVTLGAQLPVSRLPELAVSTLGLDSADHFALEGTIGISFGMLSGDAELDLTHLDLSVALPNARPVKLPHWLTADPAVQRTLSITYLNGELAVNITDIVEVNLDETRRTFILSANLAPSGELNFHGRMAGPWSSPFGLDWLNLDEVALSLSAQPDGTTTGVLSGQVDIGGRTTLAAIEVISVNGQRSARFRSVVDQLSFTDLIDWVQQRLGVSPFGEEAPDGLLDLSEVTLEIQSAPNPQFTISAKTSILNGLTTRMLFTTIQQAGEPEPVLSFGLDDFPLSSLSSQFAGSFPGDIELPATAFTFSRVPLSLPSSELSADALEFFQNIHGRPDFTFKTEAGVSFSAQLPVSLLPAQAVSVLGMDPNDKLALEGTVGISFGMLSGQASLNLNHLDLGIAFPNAQPVLLPSWLTADPSVQRTLALSYRNLPGANHSLALRVTDRVGITLDGARRSFVLSTSLSPAAELAFEGRLDGSWSQPFGVDWLTLDEVLLSLFTDGTESRGALRSSFPLGGKDIELGIAVSGTSGNPSVELEGTVDQLTIEDVIELVRRQIDRPLFPGSPPADFATLKDATITIRLGPTRSFSIGATGFLADREAELLWSIESEPGQEPHILLGIQPAGWTLGGAFPALSNPIVDSLQFPTPTLVFSNGQKRKQPHEVQAEEKRFYGKIYGPGEWDLSVPSGLGLLGGIPLDALPSDGPLRQLLQVLGMEGDNLILEGSLGEALSLVTGGGGGGGLDALRDLSLRIGLPLMRPAGSPEWFVSGQLALEITGAPSVAVVGEITVEVEGDMLTFFIESGIAFPGPSLNLVGGLMADEGWISPFGIEWLTLHKLVVAIGVDATGSAKLGFSGDMILDEKDIQVAALITVNATGVPINLVLEGASAEGLALSDIVALQARMAAVANPGAPRIPIDQLPEMAIRNLGLKFALLPEPVLDIEAGLFFSGDFYMQLQKDGPLNHIAGTRLQVGEGEISASGELISGSLGPINWRDPHLDLMLSLQRQHLTVGGFAETEIMNGDLDLAVTREQMSFDFTASVFNQFQVELHSQAELNFANPGFPINGNMLEDFLTATTDEVRDRFSNVAAQGQAAIAEAQQLVSQAQALKSSRDTELGSLLQTLIEELDIARRTMELAKSTRDSAWSARVSALNARNSAWNLYLATPNYQVALKAARYSDYLVKAAVYSAQNTNYQAAHTSYLIAKAAYDLLPPVDANPVVIALRDEINNLDAQLQSRRQQLTANIQMFEDLIEAVQEGAIAIESASFDTTLRGLIDTKQLTLRLTIRLAGSPTTTTATWDFTRTVPQNLQPVIDQILRQRGII